MTSMMGQESAEGIVVPPWNDGGEAGEPTQRVGVTKGAAGVDGMSISTAVGLIRQNWEAICSTVENGRYKPMPD